MSNTNATIYPLSDDHIRRLVDTIVNEIPPNARYYIIGDGGPHQIGFLVDYAGEEFEKAGRVYFDGFSS